MTRRLKIGIVTQYYAPDLPSWTPTGLARELADRGHSVRVLTTFPHYRTGRVSDGYRQSWKLDELDGSVRVRRVPMIPSHSTNPLGRIANYVSFAISSRSARGFLREADVIYVYATPMTVAEGPRAWAKSLNIPYVLHVQDLWPESMTGSALLPRGVAKVAEALLSPWLKSVYNRASAAIAIAPTMREILVDRGLSAERVHVVLNWSNEFDSASHEASEHPRSDTVRIAYAGNLGRMQDLETVIRAAARVQDLSNVEFAVAGSGILREQLVKLARDLGALNVDFVGQLSSVEMGEFYRNADFQLVTLRDLPGFRGIIPSKMTSGLASGVPAITTVRGDTTTMVEHASLGFSANPESVDSLEAAIRRAAATSVVERIEYADRARAYYREHMSKTHAIDRIESLLRSAAEGTEK